jgi:hypothetical protein
MDGIQCKPEIREIEQVAPALQTIIQPQQIHLVKLTPTTGLNDSIKESKRL